MRWSNMKQDAKLAMVSQPMGGKSDAEIKKELKRVTEVLNKKGYEVVDSFFESYEYSDNELKRKGIKLIPVYLLAESIKKMSEVDLVYFIKGWKDYRGCVIEHQIATQYGIKIIEE